MHTIGPDGLNDYAEKLEPFINQIPDYALYMLDLSGRIISWNAGAERLKGYAAQEIMGRSFSVFFTAEDMAADKPGRALEIAAREGTYQEEGLRVRKDGAAFWAAVTITALRDKKGTLQGFAKLTRDITEHKHHEAALQVAREARGRALFENSHDAILLTRPEDGAVLAANPAACDLFAYREQELLAMQRDQLLDFADPRFVEAWVERADVGAAVAELTFIRNGDVRFAARVSSKLFSDESGDQVACTCIHDIAEQKRIEEALRASEEKYRTLFDNMTEGFMLGEPILDAAGHAVDHRYLAVNDAFYVQTGIPRGIEGRRMRECFPQIEQFWIDRYAAVARTGEPDRFDDYNIDTRRHYDIYAFSPSPGRFAVLFRDSTERTCGEQALKESEERFRLLFENAPIGIVLVDQNGAATTANKEFLDMTGYAPEEVTGLTASQTAVPEEDAVAAGRLEQLLAGNIKINKNERRLVCKDGSAIWIRLTSTMMRDKQGQPRWGVAIIENIAERKQAEEDLKQAMEASYHQATHDMLTGLANRAAFHDRLTEALAYAKRDGHLVAIHLLDLDRFKSINDTLGHHFGDLLLKEVAKRIKSHVRATDLAVRLGGDEFVVIQTHLAEPAAAALLAGKLVESLGCTYALEEQEVHSGASIGIAVFPNDAEAPEQLIKQADLALYEAKHRGRFNYQFYRPELGIAFQKAQQSEQELLGALRGNEFCLHYQPQFDAKNGRITGIEALLRWHHPTRGTLAAAAFIQDAERARLMPMIGEWSLRTACRQYKEWVDSGLAVPLTLNLSSLQVRDPRFLQMLKRILEETGLPAPLLQLEMRESVLWDSKFPTSLLKQIKENGLRLALDEVGAEMTTLPTLDRFPLDAVKPDQGLVRKLDSQKREAAILTAIIDVAHHLKIAVCADGVETAGQLAAVEEQGCDSVQGNLLSSPLAAEEMKRMIERELAH